MIPGKEVTKLIRIKPGKYLSWDRNVFITVNTAGIGLVIGDRVTNDNVSVVLLDNQLILVPHTRSISLL